MTKTASGAPSRRPFLAALAAVLALSGGACLSAQEMPSGAKADVKLYTLDCGLTEFKKADVFSDTGEYDGKPLALPTPCYLIKHGNEWMLWDTGLGDKLAAHPGGVEKFGGHFSVKRTVASQLAELGLQPDDVRYVGISHLHFDHAGNIGLFAKATFIVAHAELAAARGKPTPFGVDLAQIQPLAQAKVIDAQDDHDVFGDGTVVTLKTPGHTAGHRALMVTLPKSGVVLISGDLYHTRQNYEKRLVPRVNERADTMASMDRFTRLQANTGARVIVQHAPEDFAAMPQFPKFLD